VYYAPATSRPRYILTYIYLAKALYPEKFSDLCPECAVNEYAAQFFPEAAGQDLFYPPFPACSCT
jgi:hypothetical protein